VAVISGYRSHEELGRFGLVVGVLPLQLTASGHQFVEALSNKEVWAAIKHGFKDASIETLKSVSVKLLEGYAQKRYSSF
jgi:hypothetical protein